MKKLLPLLLLILIGCSNPEPLNFHLLEERDGVYYREDTNEIHSGPVFTLYPDEKFHIIFEESTLKDGKLHGSYKSYYENGQIQEEKTYNNGVLDGPFKFYNLDGKIEEEGTMKSDKIYGYYKQYEYLNGDNYDKLSFEITLKNGIPNGPSKSYYENGQIQEEGTFKDDKKNGLWKSYHENGKVKLEEIYKDGELIESKEY